MFIIKNVLKKTLISIIICMTLVLSLPICSSAMTTDDVTDAMTALKGSAYPQSNYWCGGNISSSLSYSSCGRASGCTCNSFNRAYQCQGFALYLAQRVTGSYPAYSLSSYAHGATSGSWRCYTKSAMGTQAFCALGLQPGDIVRAAYNSSYSSGHTAVVWKVENGKVYFAEAWGSVYCKINWGGFNYASYSLSSICSKYSYVALWRNTAITPSSGECKHNYVSMADESHPHREYIKCLKCGKTEYTGTYLTLDSCVCCNGIHEYTYYNEETHPHYEWGVCNRCQNTAYTGRTVIDQFCPGCFGLPYNMKAEPSRNSAFIGEEVAVDIYADNAVSFSATLKCDGDRVIETVDVEDGKYSFVPMLTGNYTVTVTAKSSDGKQNTVTSEAVSVYPALNEVTISDEICRLRYDTALSEEEAAEFCAERKLTLREHTKDSFYAEAVLDRSVYEQIEQTLYSFIPLKLSYYEILRFCELTGKSFAYSDSKEMNSMLSELCVKAGSGGLLLAANDVFEESLWVDYLGTPLEYTSWNASYNASPDRYKNYLFMYPGGSWTDSVSMPGLDYGFVVSEVSTFSYTEKEDGTLELCGLPVKSSKTLTIPSTHEGKRVTSISEEAFSDCSFDTVVIPDSVTSIPDNAFDTLTVFLFKISRDSGIEEYFINKGFNYSFIMPFADVKEGSWYYDSMFYCYSNRYVSGTSAKAFSPALTCTREMFVTVLSRVMKADTSEYTEASSFEDVLPGQWYSAPIEWAYANGITSGTGNGKFGIGKAVTREQIALFLYNLGAEPAEEQDLSVFTDAGDISDWALEAVNWSVSKGLIKGTSATTLEPKRTAMRTELCQMIYNYCEKCKP